MKMKYEKMYISVNITVDESGKVCPREIILADGRVFQLDKVKRVAPAASLKVGGCGMRYTVMIQGRERYIFEENGRWFVERKCM